MVIISPDQAHEQLMYVWPEELSYREKVVCLFLDQDKTLISYDVTFIGGMTSCIIDERIVFRTALLEKAHYVVIAHNHPNGNINPSKEDMIIAKKIERAASIVSIPIAQLIVTKNRFYVISWFKGIES